MIPGMGVSPGVPREAGAGGLLAKNALWTLAGTGSPMLIGLLAIPLLVRTLGVERFGILTIAWMLVGYLSFLDMGLGRALTKLVAERIHVEEQPELRSLIWTALLLLFLVGFLGGVTLWLVSPWLVERALRIPEGLRFETLRAFQLLAIGMPAVVGGAGARGILEARQRFEYVNTVRVFLGVWTFLSPFIVLPFSRSLVAIVGLLVVGRFISWFVQLILAGRILPGLRRPVVPRPDLAMMLLSLGGWMTISNVVGPLMVYFDRFLITGLLSVAAVAYYVTPYEVVTKLWLIPAAASAVLFPAFAEAFTRAPDRVIHLLDRTQQFLFMALFPLALVGVAFSPEALAFWLGPAFAENAAKATRWLVAGAFVNGMTQVPFALIQAAGRADLTAKLHAVELPFYLGSIWWLIGKRGIEGVGIAWAVRILVDSVILFWLIGKLLPGSRPSLAREAVGIGTALALLGISATLGNTGTKVALDLFIIAAFIVYMWKRRLKVAEREWVRRRWRAVVFGFRGEAS